MNHNERQNRSFLGVSILFILLGAAVFSFGAAAWFFNYFTETSLVYIPSQKIIGGLIIIALGYIIFELELIRKK